VKLLKQDLQRKCSATRNMKEQDSILKDYSSYSKPLFSDSGFCFYQTPGIKR
jgi:hypothetical protein